MDLLNTLIDRVVNSYEQANKDRAIREENGIQPSLPGTNITTLLIANGLYLIMVAIIYFLMSNRKEGFKLKGIIAIYNAICVFLAGYCVWGIVQWKLSTAGGFVCNTLDLSKEGTQIGWIFWVFYAQKYWEYLDTFFFLLRKSFRQVTFLHIYHHMSITFVVGLIIPDDYNADMFLPLLLNSLVHVLMYAHYLATTLGVNSWWRHYLTSLQLLQFCGISLQSIVAFWRGPSCGTPDYAKVVLILYMISMLVLFGNFYLQRYVAPKKKKEVEEKSQ